jgi:hypothetical protein
MYPGEHSMTFGDGNGMERGEELPRGLEALGLAIGVSKVSFCQEGETLSVFIDHSTPPDKL